MSGAAAGAGPPAVAPNSVAATTGMVAITTPTRRYCTTATTRSSPPSSRVIAVSPDAPPAVRASIPVSGETSRRRPISNPADMLTTNVATPTSNTGTVSPASAASVDGCPMTPITTPITAIDEVTTGPGTRSGARPARASAVATSSPPNRAGDGIPAAARPAATAAVRPISDAHRRPFGTRTP